MIGLEALILLGVISLWFRDEGERDRGKILAEVRHLRSSLETRQKRVVGGRVVPL